MTFGWRGGALGALAVVLGCSAGEISGDETAATGVDGASVPGLADPFASGAQSALQLGSVQQALSFASLPACRFFNEGVVYYVHSPAARVGFYYCRSGSWRLVSAGAGTAGPTGAVGPTGPGGAAGATGPTGPRGSTGPAGTALNPPEQLVRSSVLGGCRRVEIGNDDNRNGQLDASEIDSTGDVCDGPAGATGATGASGATGARGATGPAGVAGPAGLAGMSGPTGPTGTTGPIGSAGVAGPTGSAGARGATGAQGPTGPRGPTGPGAPAEPTLPVCGNGVVEAGEQCDRGAANGGSECTLQCQSLPVDDFCLTCAAQACPTQYAEALGTAIDATHLAAVTQLLDCVVGSNSHGFIPASSCFFADPAQPRGSLLPCYCGSTPQTACIANGPAQPSEACGDEVILASGCDPQLSNPALNSCVVSVQTGSALSRALNLLNCERVACEQSCGFPRFEDDDPPPPPPPPPPPGPYCGDSIVQAGEQCDLGKANGNSSCTVTCQLPPLGVCLSCVQSSCPLQFQTALGPSSQPAVRKGVTELLDCIVGPDFELGGPVPATSCWFGDPAQPSGSLLPCYCGSTPSATCRVSGPAQPAEACGARIQAVLGCDPLTTSCQSGPSSAFTQALQVLQCEAGACAAACGFPAPAPPVTAVCGNSIVEAGEQCDLGFANGGPSCSQSCQLLPLGSCLSCAQNQCPVQFGNALGVNSTPSNRALVTQLLDCVAGPDFGRSGIPDSSCFFSDPNQSQGSLLPCFCGATPQAICLSAGPLVPEEACGKEIQLASGCPSTFASCVTSAGSDPATALGDTLQLLNCLRVVPCQQDCNLYVRETE